MWFKFDVQKMIPSQMNFNIARRYHEHDIVEMIEIKEEKKSYFVYSMLRVKGSEIECNFEIDEFGNLIDYHCDCYFCTSKSPCAHIGAVLFKLNQLKIEAFPYHYEKINEEEKFNFRDFLAGRRKEQEERERQRQKAMEEQERQRKKAREEYLERLRLEEERRKREKLLSEQNETWNFIREQKEENMKQVISSVDSTIYSIFPEVERKGADFELSYRVGTDQKKYVMKNMDEFIRSFKSKATVSYGKNFSIKHELERFDEFSIRQIGFLEKVISKPIINRYNMYEYHRYTRSLPLDTSVPSLFHEFFEMYLDREFPTFKCVDEIVKLPFSLIQEKEDYCLKFNARCSFTIENNEIYIMPDNEQIPYKFIRMKLDQERIISKLVNHFIYEETLHIHKDHLNDFKKYILEPIKDYIELTDESPNNEVTQENNDIYVYGDVDENGDIIFDVYSINSNNERVPAFMQGSQLTYNQEVVEFVIKEYAKTIEIGKAYFDTNSEKTLKFCSEGVLKLQPYCNVYISDALKGINVKPKYSITVGVRVENDLIHMDINSDDIPKEDLAGVLAAYRRKKKFYRLKNGDMINIDSEDIEELNQLMDDYHIDTKELKKEDIQLDKYRMFELEESTKKSKLLEVTKEDSYKQLMDDFKQVSLSEIKIPEQYDSILRDYQKEGYRWLHTMYQYNFNGILADDMGLGKTLQVISLLDGIQSQLPSIVVCPASLVYNWEDEVHKFSQTMKVGCVVGSKAMRTQIIKDAAQYNLLVTSYDYMRRDIDDYCDCQFEYVILDEAQNIKNQKTKNAESVKQLVSKHRLALTGTPIENTLAELWSIFDFLMPDYLFNYHYFKKKYESPIVKNGNMELSNQLKRMVSPFILRRNKMDVLKELPEKIQTVQIIPFDEEENKLYLANLAQINQQLAEMLEIDQTNDFVILGMLTRLRQLCIEPRMVYENIAKPSSKLNALLELLIQLKENNQKVLVFSAFPSVFEYIEDDLRANHISYMELTGKNTKEERREMVGQFQNGDVDVFLISLKAGGTGLNLTKASAVIHIDPWWNLSAQNQATDRAHRIGQLQTVQVFKLVMKNSIEEKIVKLQEKKKELSDLFVENNEGSISKMTKSEIIDLFKMN